MQFGNRDRESLFLTSKTHTHYLLTPACVALPEIWIEGVFHFSGNVYQFERYMFERIAAVDARVTLVICGRRHMRGLEQRLAGAGVVVSIYDVL